MNKTLRERAGIALFLAALTLPMVSCATRGEIDFSSYPRIPSRPTSVVYRVAAKSNPITRKAAFYGNYGGPGSSGGAPVDRMDELFRRHDLAYWHCRSLPTMIRADQELVRALNELDPNDLSPRAQMFRRRAMDFFSSRTSRIVGKPVSAYFISKERPGDLFADERAVSEFFRSEEDPYAPGWSVALKEVP